MTSQQLGQHSSVLGQNNPSLCQESREIWWILSPATWSERVKTATQLEHVSLRNLVRRTASLFIRKPKLGWDSQAAQLSHDRKALNQTAQSLALGLESQALIAPNPWLPCESPAFRKAPEFVQDSPGLLDIIFIPKISFGETHNMKWFIFLHSVRSFSYIPLVKCIFLLIKSKNNSFSFLCK